MLGMPRIFYGWWLVAVCLLVQGVAAGVTMYSFSIFAGELETEFSASRALVMLGLTGGNLMIGLLAPLLGGVMDRWSVKGGMMLSGIIMGIGFILMSFSPTLWGVIAGYVLLLPVGGSVLAILSSPLLLSRWFVRRRGLALGIAALGTQFGGFAFPPMIAGLIEVADWRLAMQVIGVFVAVVVPLLTYLVIVDYPHQRGLAPDGEGEPEAPPESAEEKDRDKEKTPGIGVSAFKAVLSQRNFWLTGLGIAIMFGPVSAVLGNLALIGVEEGASREQAAMLISVYAVVGMVSSPLIGRVCDLVDIRVVFAGLLVNFMIAMFGFMLADGYAALMAATVVMAIGGGGVMPFWGAVVGRLFDISLYGRVMGAMSLLVLTSSSGAPMLAGWIFDVTGGYYTLFAMTAALMVIPLLYTPLIRKPAAVPTAA